MPEESSPHSIDRLTIDLARGFVRVENDHGGEEYSLGTAEAFDAISRAWLRSGWDTKYVYGFSWLGRPIIQLPEDMIRHQELMYSLKPDVIVETGVAHGGSLIFYASICKAVGHGRVIGVDIEIRRHNRMAIEAHELFPLITLIEGPSTDTFTFEHVRAAVGTDQRTLVILDSAHDKAHVLAELELYSELVQPGSYIVAMDGIMGDLGGAPRTAPDWTWNNPRTAVREFVDTHPHFVLDSPPFPFNEGAVESRVTYAPDGWIRRIA